MKNPKPVRILAAKVPDALIKKIDKAARLGGRTRSSELRLRIEASFRETAQPSANLKATDASAPSPA